MSAEEQAKQVVQQLVSAFDRGDLDALRSLPAQEAETQRVFGKGTIQRLEVRSLVVMKRFEIEAGRIKRRWGARNAASQAWQLGIGL